MNTCNIAESKYEKKDIKTSLNSDRTLCLVGDTPHGMYDVITSAVMKAKGYSDLKCIRVENLISDHSAEAVIGWVVFDPKYNSVKELNLKEWVIDEYGCEWDE